MFSDVCPARTKDAMLLKLKLQGHAPITPNPMLVAGNSYVPANYFRIFNDVFLKSPPFPFINKAVQWTSKLSKIYSTRHGLLLLKLSFHFVLLSEVTYKLLNS